jgi:branched-chain amino acid transport system substrate-binding protein
MVDHSAADPGSPPAAARERAGADSITRGFLFSDLRGYTSFVERHGAASGAELLLRYRRMVRAAIERFEGAEIRTEGDSFYVVFDSVSGAVRCGIAIVEASRLDAADRSDAPIRVGVGIHAGETVETSDGYVGSPVNIAARICAAAAQGEVLVSDTVRTLTQSVLPVRFQARGRQRLKGVAEPIALFEVAPADAGAIGDWSGTGRRGLTRRRAVVAGAGAAVVLGGVLLAASAFLRPPPGLPPGPWVIALDMPLSGVAAFRGEPVRDAVKLAIDDANAAGGISGQQIELDIHDDASSEGPNGQDPAKGAANTRAIVNNPRVVAMIGPWGSGVAASEIPITNQAGLLQCSPANSSPELTKPDFGALALRPSAPSRISYIRVAPSDDIQGPALASFAFNDLKAKSALVIDDTDFGKDIAEPFAESFTALGGRVVRRSLAPGADPETVLQPLAASDPPDLVFFGGFTDTGAPEVRAAMAAGGHGSIEFLSWDGILDGSGADEGSYIQRAGAAAVGSYMSHASLGPPKAAFQARFRAAYGRDPDEYSAAAYTCAQVILESLRAVAATGPSAEGLREAVRAYAVDPSRRYETVLGIVGFDANGDSIQQFVTFYTVEASAAGGKGDWVIDKQQDFGPAP